MPDATERDQLIVQLHNKNYIFLAMLINARRRSGGNTSSSGSGRGEEHFAHVSFVDTLFTNDAISCTSLARELVRHLEELTMTISAQNNATNGAQRNSASVGSPVHETVGCCGIISGLCSGSNSRYSNDVSRSLRDAG